MLVYVPGGNEGYYKHICEGKTRKWNNERPQINVYDMHSIMFVKGEGIMQENGFPVRIDYCPFCGMNLFEEDKDNTPLF